MLTKRVKVAEIQLNPENPRVIKEDKFKDLVKSIKKFPKMLDVRPIAVNEDMVIVGGNMRFKAALEAGMKEVPIVILKGFTEAEQREFVIKDNIAFGEWDFEMLANEWDVESLSDWGLDIPMPNANINLDEFFEQGQEVESVDGKKKLILEYTDEEYTLVKNALLKHGKTPEAAVFNLLGL